MKTTTMETPVEHFQRSIQELCELVGFKNYELLLNGGKLRIEDYRISFIFDESYSIDKILVYIDIGPPKGKDKEHTFTTFLKLNFKLLAGTRGVISMHPENGHIFYSFPYSLNASSSGRELLDALLRFIDNVGIEAFELPQDVKDDKEAVGVASRMRAARILQPKEVIPKK